jgi:hypothetical protein
MLVKFFQQFISTPKTDADKPAILPEKFAAEDAVSEQSYRQLRRRSPSRAVTVDDSHQLGETLRILPRSRVIEPVDFNSSNRSGNKSATVSYQEKTHRWLQTHLDNPLGPTIKLLPQEYAGPFVVSQPITLDGQGATLWAFKGPVLQVLSPTLTLKNLNIEVTGESCDSAEEECAIRVSPKTVVHCENVQVRGQVMGIEGETGVWHYPYSLHLGQLAQLTTQQFILQIQVPMSCYIESAIAGVHLTPPQLEAGYQPVMLTIEPLADDTSLCGSLYIKTAHLKRRIQLTAHISATVSSKNQSIPVIWAPTGAESLPLSKLLPTVEPVKQSSLAPPSHAEIPPESSKPLLSTHQSHLNRLEESVFFTKQTPKSANQPTTTRTKGTLANSNNISTQNVFSRSNRDK